MVNYREKGIFEKKKILKEANFLDLTPVRKHGHETDDQGNVVILIPRFTDFIGKRWLQPRLKHPYMKLSLDEQGSTTWLLADGQNTVRDICRIAEEKLGEKIQPAADRVTTFFSHLYMRKIITFKEIIKS
ncbi:MAG: PqqD family protein [Bacteroidota bacterium]